MSEPSKNRENAARSDCASTTDRVTIIRRLARQVATNSPGCHEKRGLTRNSPDSAHQTAKLLLHFGLDFSLEHHGGQWQIATNSQVRVTDGDFSRDAHSQCLKTKFQAVLIPGFLKIAHLPLKFTFHAICKMFQAFTGIFPGLRMGDCKL